MTESDTVPQPSLAAAGAEHGEATTTRAPFVPPAVSELGKLTGLTQLGTSNL